MAMISVILKRYVSNFFTIKGGKYMEWKRNEFVISDDKSLINIDSIHGLLSKSYWAKDRTKDTIKKSVEGSIVFGVYHKEIQVGFARVVSDKATFAWICDVIINEDFRGQGLGKWLMECVVNYSDIKNTKQLLATRDAHGLYEKYGFKSFDTMVKAPQ